MSKRIDESWIVFASIENNEHDRCVDIFARPDGKFGFEEFRRDVEDGGEWTPTAFYSGSHYVTAELAYEAAPLFWSPGVCCKARIEAEPAGVNCS